MLSRIAESLYWIGRNVERAEDTCRILDVHLQLLVEDPSVDTQLSAATLYAVLGMAPPEGPVTSDEVLRTIQYHPTAPCSVPVSYTHLDVYKRQPWFDGYPLREDSFDEMFCPDGSLRPGAARVVEALGQLDPDELRTRVEFLQRTYVDQGVTFDAVSYTHLDVYKRQRLDRAVGRAARPPDVAQVLTLSLIHI